MGALFTQEIATARWGEFVAWLRSGPGQLFLASPLSVAASAVAGKIVAYEEGMFGRNQ